MTTNGVCLALLALGYAWLFAWAFRRLPGESWQFLAAVPGRKDAGGAWAGVNLTIYGALTATGVTVGLALWLVLAQSLGVGPMPATLLAAALLGATVPAAKGIARVIERKPHTFTIGGAASLGFLVAPWVVVGLSHFGGDGLGQGLPVMPLLAALAIAYAIGEGTGRLACISFGCCYGRPLEGLTQSLVRLFHSAHFVFRGATKKAAYEGGFEAVPLVPIQGMTAVLSVGVGLVGLLLFVREAFTAAFLFTVLATQGWRVLSEFLRADYRGGQRVSSYQIMAAVNAFYALVVAQIFPAPARIGVDLLLGVGGLWNPALLLAIELCWILIFLYTGRSRVTTSSLSFSVIRDRV